MHACRCTHMCLCWCVCALFLCTSPNGRFLYDVHVVTSFYSYNATDRQLSLGKISISTTDLVFTLLPCDLCFFSQSTINDQVRKFYKHKSFNLRLMTFIKCSITYTSIITSLDFKRLITRGRKIIRKNI